MTDFIRPDIVNYKTVIQHNGRYRLKRTPLSTGTSASIPLIAGSNQAVQFKIPARTIFNPARTSLDFQIFFAAEATKANWCYEDTVSAIASIQFGNASGILLVDLPSAANYVNAVRRLDTSQVEFESNDYMSGLYKAKSLAVTDNNFYPSVNIPAVNTFGESGAANVGLPIFTPITIPDAQYSRTAGVAVNTALTCSRSIPLSAFKGTLFAMDRDLIFGEEMQITIQLAPSGRVGFNSTSFTNPATAPTAVFAIQPAIQNFYMNLAIQVDNDVEAYVRSGFESGKLLFIFPFVHTSRVLGQAAGMQSVSITYPAQMGKTLKRIVHVPYNATESTVTGFDHQNMNGVKVSSYQTYMDTNPLQENLVSCLQPICDDFRENRQYLKGSSIENSSIYYYNWMHVDSFSNPKRDAELPTDNILEGLDMSASRNWVFTGTCSSNLVFYTFASFVRQISCRPDMTEVFSKF